MNPGLILYITNDKIDRAKWDACIERAANGLIYAYSFYLDHMAEHWNALVLNDYEAVMPLTWNRKYSFYYLYQPFATASLGIFGRQLSAALIEDFLKTIPAKFKYWDIYLNNANFASPSSLPFYGRVNYILPLTRSYNDLFQGFSDNVKRNIRKAEQSDCYIIKDFAIEKVIELASRQMKDFAKTKKSDFNRFSRLYNHLHQQKKAITYKCYTAQQELVAACAFFFSHNRAYYILAGNTLKGKEIGASHALLNAFIKDHADEQLLLDFEGSDVPGVARFYSSFGASEENYPGIRHNRLPILIRWLKK